MFVVCFLEARYVVLDEADRMLDEGFEPAIKKIMSYCPASSAQAGETTMISV